MKRAHHRHLLSALIPATVLAAALAGCTKIEPPVRAVAILPQTSESNVLRNLQTAYKTRDIQEYAKLLAEDFQFYFDEGTRQQNGTLPVFWNQFQDSVETGALFASSDVTDIRIDLSFGSPRPVSEIGRENWTSVDVLDTFLEVDLRPQPGELEGLTLRVDGQKQKFLFRKGRNPADTDTTTSATAKLYYITEWRDFGMQGKPEIASAHP